jgi:hypothetical protein
VTRTKLMFDHLVSALTAYAATSRGPQSPGG